MSHNGEIPSEEIPKTILDVHLKKEISTEIANTQEALNLLSHSGIFKNEALMNRIMDYIVSNLESINTADREKMATFLSQHFIFLNVKLADHPERVGLAKRVQETLLVLNSK